MENSMHCYFFLCINHERSETIKYFRIFNKFLSSLKLIFANHRLSNVLFNFSLGLVQFFFLMANRPVSETSCRQTVLSATFLSTKCSFGETSCQRNVLSTNCPVGELFVVKVSVYRQRERARHALKSGPFRKAYNKKLFSIKTTHNRPKTKSV